MKMMKAIGLSLACLLPFSVNAADVCLQISEGGLILKFKKPVVPKMGAAEITGTLIAPPTGAEPVRLGFLNGNVIAHKDGSLDYSVYGWDDIASGGDISNIQNNIRFIVIGADKKTFSGTAQGWVNYHDSINGASSSDVVHITSIDCKTVPEY